MLDFQELSLVPVEVGILVMLVGFVFHRPLHQFLILMTTLSMALFAVRNIAISAAAATPTIAWSYGAAWERLGLEQRVGPWLRERRDTLRLVTAAALVLITIAVAVFIHQQLA